eukprot:gene13897-18634_t
MDLEELTMMLETLDSSSVSDEEFERASHLAKQIKHLDNEQKLLLYGLYKQSTIGDIDIPKPAFYELTNTSKWNAWNNFKGYPKNSSALAYVYLVSQLTNGEDGVFSCLKTSFAESGGSTAASISTLNHSNNINDNWNENEKMFEAVVLHDLDLLKKCIALNSNDINSKNVEGLTPLHFAADRGYIDIALLLLTSGAVINAQDNLLHTPLMNAVLCENEEMVKFLLEKSADITILNDEGLSVLQFDDILPSISTLLKEKIIT